ncbi:unnamed protein product, partial [Iphiclides podalirius]
MGRPVRKPFLANKARHLGSVATSINSINPTSECPPTTPWKSYITKRSPGWAGAGRGPDTPRPWEGEGAGASCT